MTFVRCMFPSTRHSAWHMASQVIVEKNEVIVFHLLTDFDLGLIGRYGVISCELCVENSYKCFSSVI